jgi:hypothetical protein
VIMHHICFLGGGGGNGMHSTYQVKRIAYPDHMPCLIF